MNEHLPPPTLASAVARIVILYALFAGLWILLSDSLVAWLFPGAATLQVASTLKGLLFVAVTSLLLFFLILRLSAPQAGDASAKVGAGETAPRLDRRGLHAGIVLLTLVFLLFGAVGVWQTWQHHRTHKGDQLRSIAALKTAQIEHWLAERRRDAEVLRSSPIFASAFAGRHDNETAAAQATRRARLESFRTIMGHERILLCDADGNILFATEGAPHPAAAPLREAVRRAIAAGQIVVGDISRHDEENASHFHLDLIAPIPVDTAGAIVLHIDAAKELFPHVEYWPLPSASAEAVLFRRDGDAIINLSNLRQAPGSALTQRTHAGMQESIVARALDANNPPGTLLEGIDYRGRAVVGIAQPVTGTDWWLLDKIDRDEIFAEAHANALWIVFASLLAWLAAVMLAVLLHQRRELHRSEAARIEQAEKLRALQLLDAIAANAEDPMFALDANGRFTFFNRAAERLTGKTAAEVLGHDEAALFPPEVATPLIAANRQAMAADAPLTFEDAIPTSAGQRLFLTTRGPLRDAAGRTVGLLGVARDITERKRFESELRRERDLNQRYLDTVETLMVALDTTGRITMINRFGLKLLGHVEEELLGRNWFEYCLPAPDGMARVYPVFQRIIAGDHELMEYFENPVRCSDGTTRLIAWHTSLLRDDAGQIVGVLSSGEDITALRRDEEELRHRNAELERFNRAMVGRELAMIDLKRHINDLSRRLGLPAPHDLAAIESPPTGQEEPEQP